VNRMPSGPHDCTRRFWRVGICRWLRLNMVVLVLAALAGAGDPESDSNARPEPNGLSSQTGPVDSSADGSDDDALRAHKAERSARALLALVGMCVAAAGLLILIAFGAKWVRRLVRRPQVPTAYDPEEVLRKSAPHHSPDEPCNPTPGDPEKV